MLTRLRVIFSRIGNQIRRDALDREFEAELAAHLAMAEEDKVRQGMPREQARREARIELGGLTQLREAGREARGLQWIDALWLDAKLGLRMLRKSWGLTLVGGLAMTVAITIGAGVFAFFDLTLKGQLPLDEGDRIVAIQTWDDKASRRHETSIDDFERWRDAARSMVELGAFQTVERNFLVESSHASGERGPSGPVESVSVAEMTASGFRLARVAPLMGRPLIAEDEQPGAAPVVVIGYHEWQSRLAADPRAVGRTVRLGDKVHTVVGVMPRGFAFPVNHGFWVPLQTAGGEVLRPGPLGSVFGRLAPGVTLENAQAELTTLGLRAAADSGEQLEARVGPYPLAFMGDLQQAEIDWVIRIVLMLVALLLVPPCANIAILVYARTVTRRDELAARFILGASRGRIVAQIFIETLVLSAGATAMALLTIGAAARRLRSQAGAEAPFWIDFGLSTGTILFAALLAVLAALIAGVVPALKATGRQMHSGLSSLGGGMRLGATWTALVVVQVAFSAAALPSAVEMGWGTVREGILGPGFATEEYLTARLEMDREPPTGAKAANDELPSRSRFGALRAELVRKLEAEPGVSGVSVTTAVPGDEPWASIEIDGLQLEDNGILAGKSLIRFNHVDEAFFGVFDIPLLTGRGFEAGDFEPGLAAGTAERSAGVVIVNQTFAEEVLGEENPLGHRVRYSSAGDGDGAKPWYEIVGVVADRPAHATRGTVYHALASGQGHPASLAVRFGSDPVETAVRLREITAALDPALRLGEILTLDEIYRQKQAGNNLGASILMAITLSVLLLSAAGIYALMSFTINQGRREIGIRAALGAPPGRLLLGVLRRALKQLSWGALGGVLVALVVDGLLPIELLGGWNIPGVIPATILLLMMIGVAATTGPAKRGLEVEPVAALREG